MIVWHYTTGNCFRQIAEDGFIKPSTTGIDDGEKPLIWFSKRGDFEPTALKGIVENGVQRTATLEEMYHRGGGLARFGIDRRRAISPTKIRQAGKIPKNIWRGLIAAARDVNADPVDWYAIKGRLDICKLDAIEVYDEIDGWLSLPSYLNPVL